MPSDAYTLVPSDHTRIMQAVLDRPLHVISYLATPRFRLPTHDEVLEAAVQVRAFEPAVREKLRIVRDVFAALTASRSAIPADLIDAVRQIVGGMGEDGVQAQLAHLERSRVGASHALLAQGIDCATAILRDGAATIYAPDHPFAELLRPERMQRRRAGVPGGLPLLDPPPIVAAFWGAVGAGDVGGALLGAAGGAIAGAGVGAIPGSVGGAVAGSAGAALGTVLAEAIF